MEHDARPDQGASQWELLRQADQLEVLEAPREVVADGQGTFEVTFDLPMPSMSFLHLAPR